MAERPLLVKAIHAYSPVNNDEIRLETGEILTVTRKEEGGWWEGTLSNGKTGWFPSNYVEDISLSPTTSSSISTSPLSSLSPPEGSPFHQNYGTGGANSNGDVPLVSQRAEYRQLAFLEIVESENSHVKELKDFEEGFLVPLQKSEILTLGEFKVLIGNLVEIINAHTLVLNSLKIEQSKPIKEQRIGSIFLENAPKLEEIHKMYCSNHPKAVQIVERYKEQLSAFVESKGGKKPGILYLITVLSQAFRRLDRYPILLQEIERHVEEFHKDRGDIQRSIEYYKEIQKTCSALRKQKEMELEVLSGAIKNWEGSDVSQLGDIIFMNFVHLGYERVPRYLVLFSNNTLVILSYNTENNCLVYEGKIPVSGVTLRPLPDKDSLVNSFEVSGPMIDCIIVNCSSKSIRETWLNHMNNIRYPSFPSSSPQQFGELTPPVQAWTIDRLRPSPPFNPFLAEYLNNLKKQRQNEAATSSTSSLNLNNKTSTASMISFGSSYTPTVTPTNEEEFAILALVDSFCNTNRHTGSSESIKSITKPVTPSNLPQSQQPRSLAQVVMLLREEVCTLKNSIKEEQKKRIALQQFVQKSLQSSCSAAPSLQDA